MRIYVSHSIRGKYGKDATYTQMQENCDAIIRLVNQLRATFPTDNFYVPAESEPFVGRAYKNGFLTEGQILEIDCGIIDGCDAVIIHVPGGDSLQGGRLIEYDHAKTTNCPVIVFKRMEQATAWIADQIMKR